MAGLRLVRALLSKTSNAADHDDQSERWNQSEEKGLHWLGYRKVVELPVAPNGLTFFHERIDAFGGVISFHEFLKVHILHLLERHID